MVQNGRKLTLVNIGAACTVHEPMNMSEQLKGEKLRPTTLNLGETERRALLSRVVERTVAEGRSVSVSEVAREMLREAAAREGGKAA
jgi:hypothetical protein